MRTSYRDIFLLACCQALLLTNAAGLITMNGLVGYELAGTKELATLGVTTYVLGSAIATMPASLWMARVGRRMGFMAGALVNVGGCALAAFAIHQRSFALYCVATAVIGIYNAIGLQYRFAAAEVAAPADRAKAISLVLAGGIVGGFIGPQSARWAMNAFATPFLGSFLVLAAYAVVALAVQSRVRVPAPTVEERSGGGRRLLDDHASANLHRRRAGGWPGLRPDEPADDGDAHRDELLRPPVRRGGVRDRMACRRDVCAGVLHRHADPPLRCPQRDSRSA